MRIREILRERREGGRLTPPPHAAAARSLSTITCFGVFDGHGGSQAADHCVDFIPAFLASALSRVGAAAEPGPALDALLTECFCAADREFLRKVGGAGMQPTDLGSLSHSLESKNLQTAGCTACLVRVIPPSSRASPTHLRVIPPHILPPRTFSRGD